MWILLIVHLLPQYNAAGKRISVLWFCLSSYVGKLSVFTDYLLTYLLTPWRRVLLEKLTGLQLVKKFLAFHGTRRFITALTSVRHLSLSWASPIQSIYPHPTSWRSILILSTHLRLGLPSGIFPSGFPTKTLYTPLSLPIRATCPAHLILLDFITRTILRLFCGRCCTKTLSLIWMASLDISVNLRYHQALTEAYPVTCDIRSYHSRVIAHSSRLRCYIVGCTRKYRRFKRIFMCLCWVSSNMASLRRRSHRNRSKRR